MIANHLTPAYSSPAGANSPAGFGDPIKLAHKRPKSIARRFFTLVTMFYGGCAWETSGSAGCQLSRFANLRTAATHIRLATISGSSTQKLELRP